MTQTDTAKVAFVGLASTGKTTYLAALWNSLQETVGDHSLRLASYPQSAAYLKAIHERWLKGEPVGHTPRDGGEHIRLDVEIDGRSLVLDVPDLSGESFEEMVVSRQIDTVVDDLLTAAAGILVFAHPDHLRTRITIAEARKMGATIPVSTEPARTPPMDRRKLPGELHIVDLLQAIRLRCRDVAAPGGARVAILVSAWDLLRPEGLSPANWVTNRMPMLHSYLSCNYTNAYRIFGVSAQGGPAGLEMAEKDPSGKARVFEPDGEEHGDVAGPIVWAADLA